MQELWFLHSACPLMLVDICMKFHDANLYGLKVIELFLVRSVFLGKFILQSRNMLAISQELFQSFTISSPLFDVYVYFR